MAASFAALTYGRYSGGRRDENSAYVDDILDLVGETAFEVSTADELVNAINNGYSYIKVVGDDPTLVVNNNVADVVVNLVLDVNGHKIVRNSRNPLLNVRQSVSVVLVYDSSTDADGGFYNPVGSALQTSGGTLTVGEGVYESGPRDKTPSSATDTVSATVYSRGGDRTAKSYSVVVENQTLPKLAKDTGDVYLDENYSGTGDYLKADTYLIYTEEKNAFVVDETGSGEFEDGQLYVNAKETSSGGTTTITADKFSPICDVASCDFYYYYPVDVAGTAKSPQTYAVVYGYNDVKQLAGEEDESLTSQKEEGEINLVWPYAAIRSEAGTTHARGGEFYTYFGEENTYSIYSEGGTMTVGLSGESDPPKFQAIGKGVCINMAGTSGNADQTLTIENGEFSSKIGDTIKMSGGEMEVKKGTFKKDATVLGAASGDGASNGSAISISGGTLSMTGAGTKTFIITGNYVNGIKMEKAENDATANIADTIENAAFSFNKESGGTSVAAIQVRNGLLNVRDSTFDFNQGYTETASSNNGIYVQGGSVVAENCTFSLSPDGSVTGSAAIASAGGTVTASGSTFTVNGFGNFGVHSSGGTVTATDCTFTMTQAGDPSGGRGDNFGIYSMRPEGVTQGGIATAEGCTINITGTYSAGVLSMDGTLNLGASQTKETSITVSFERNELSSSGVSSEGGEINLTGNTTITSAGLGITARGEIKVTGGTSTVKTERGTGIYVQNGTLTVEEGATVEVDSKINDTCSWVVPPEHTGDESLQTNKYNGVYVYGGSLKSEGELNVTFTGVQNESHDSYDALKIRSYAVRVEAAATGGNSEVSIAGGTISNSVGGGVYVGGGTVTLGVRGEGGPTIGTTGVSFGDENTSAGGGNWKYYENKTGGHAVEVNGGALLVYGGLYTAALGNGILVRGGDAWVLNGTFQGNDTGVYRDNYGEGNLPAGPAAYYALKLLGGSVTTFGGTFGTYTTDDNTEHTAGGSSAFVTGVSSQATANIYGGSFKVGGQAGFSVYQNVALEFTPNNKVTVGEGSEAQTLQGSAVEVSAATTAIAIENTTNTNVSVTINGGTFESTRNDSGQRDGIWDSNPYAKLTINQLEEKTTISAQAKHGINLVYAPAIENGVTITGGTITGKQDGIHYGSPAASGAVTISGGTITGSNHGVYYGARGAVNDGLLIEGGTIEGKSGAGLYFAANPWQNNGGVTNNVAIVGGTFIGVSVYHYAVSDGDKYWTNGAIGAPSNSQDNGLGHDIQITDIIVCDPNLNPGKSIYYSESPRGENDYSQTLQYYYDKNLQLGEGFRDDQKINQTTCRYNRVEIR